MTPQRIGTLFVSAFRDELDLTEKGWKSLDDCRSDAEVLWNALYDPCAIAHGLYGGDGAPEIKREFERRLHFEFCPNAGMMTRKDNHLMAGYRDVYQGRELNCEVHIKAGPKESDPGSVRAYFAYDAPSGEIVISGCGAHHDNFSTRKVRQAKQGPVPCLAKQVYVRDGELPTDASRLSLLPVRTRACPEGSRPSACRQSRSYRCTGARWSCRFCRGLCWGRSALRGPFLRGRGPARKNGLRTSRRL